LAFLYILRNGKTRLYSYIFISLSLSSNRCRPSGNVVIVG